VEILGHQTFFATAADTL